MGIGMYTALMKFGYTYVEGKKGMALRDDVFRLQG